MYDKLKSQNYLALFRNHTDRKQKIDEKIIYKLKNEYNIRAIPKVRIIIQVFFVVHYANSH